MTLTVGLAGIEHPAVEAAGVVAEYALLAPLPLVLWRSICRNGGCRRHRQQPAATADPGCPADGHRDVGLSSRLDVREPVYYSPDADRACAAVLQLRMATGLVTDLDAALAQRALDRLRATLDAHNTGDGVWFDSRVWLVTAYRR